MDRSSAIALPFNFGLPWAKALENYPNDEVAAMFHFVIQHNEGWQAKDEVVAVGDYSTVITYQEVKRKEQCFGWERYQPAKIPLRKLETPERIGRYTLLWMKTGVYVLTNRLWKTPVFITTAV